MKKILILILIICTVQGAYAQQAMLLNKTWKVKAIYSTFQGNYMHYFNVDSTSNIYEVATLQFIFKEDSSYTKSYGTGDNFTGKYFLVDQFNAAIIDDKVNKVTQIDEDNFVFMSYTQQVINDAGALDTVFNYVHLITTNGTTLNNQFLSLTSSIVNNKTLLAWKVPNDNNVLHYEILHSLDGNRFTKVGMVQSLQATNTQQYNFLHVLESQGVHYYKIKKVNVNGMETFSAIVKVNTNTLLENNIRIYPNPASENIVVSLNNTVVKNAYIRIVSVTGVEVFKKVLNADVQTQSIVLPTLKSGLYLTEIIEGDKRIFVDKLMINSY
jgi:hypothetical protein